MEATAGKARVAAARCLGTFVQQQHAHFLLSRCEGCGQSRVARADQITVINRSRHRESTPTGPLLLLQLPVIKALQAEDLFKSLKSFNHALRSNRRIGNRAAEMLLPVWYRRRAHLVLYSSGHSAAGDRR